MREWGKFVSVGEVYRETHAHEKDKTWINHIVMETYVNRVVLSINSLIIF